MGKVCSVCILNSLGSYVRIVADSFTCNCDIFSMIISRSCRLILTAELCYYYYYYYYYYYCYYYYYYYYCAAVCQATSMAFVCRAQTVTKFF